MTVTADQAEVRQRLAAACAAVEKNVTELRVLRSQLATTRRSMHQARDARVPTHDQVVHRLQSKLESLPVIEQAKGVIIAQMGGDPDRAFDVLRRASQRTNVKVRDLAADIVDRAGHRSRAC